MLQVDYGMVASIKNFLMPKQEKENELNELRPLFFPALNFVKMDVHNLLVLFQDQKTRGDVVSGYCTYSYSCILLKPVTLSF
jgi:hypothetical protein